MTLTAAVAGGSGYAGGELLRLLHAHPDFSIGPVAAGRHTDVAITDVHPHLIALAGQHFVATDAHTLGEADVVFLALPHGESGKLVSQLPNDCLVVDLGADFRLTDANAWQKYYGGEHAGTWVYGLPELPGARTAITQSKRVANPGCFPTGIILGLAPLLAADLVEPDDVVVVAASGTSGAGRGLKDSLLGSEVMNSMSAYKVGGVHQHTPEIEQALSAAGGDQVTVLFTPSLAPMPRGILATSTAKAAPGVTTEEVHAALHAAYAHEPFVQLLPPGQWPTTGAVLGSNQVYLQAVADAHSGRVTVVSAIDNLTKGAAGQAIQNANLMAGFAETSGLTGMGVAP